MQAITGARIFGTEPGRLWVRAVTHHHDLRVALVLDDVHGVLSAVHDGCLNLGLAESLQGSTFILPAYMYDLDEALTNASSHSKSASYF